MPRRRPLVIGHRGAPGYRPEHSRSSYDLAFAMGVDAVEPDIVPTRDGVLVVRHENDISGTTDVASRPEYADRRTTRTVDGQKLTGWFTEDFTWAELSHLRTRERIARTRPASATFDGAQPMMRLTELLELVTEASAEHGREIGVVLEVKHPTHFAAGGIDVAPLIERDLRATGWWGGALPLTVECFELDILDRLKDAGAPASFIFLLDSVGAPADEVARSGPKARSYASFLTPAGLDALSGRVDGISVNKSMILAPDRRGRATGPAPFVAGAHERGMVVFTWTARPENRFLIGEFRGPGGKDAFGDYESEWTLLRDAGIDGVFVDHPDLGVGFFRG